MNILVTGGAGYIGSHVARQLVEADHEIVVLDNLSTGHAWAVLGAELIRGDLADANLLGAMFAAKRFEAALHFAAAIVMPESVSEPLKYYANNTANTLKRVETMRTVPGVVSGLIDQRFRHA